MAAPARLAAKTTTDSLAGEECGPILAVHYHYYHCKNHSFFMNDKQNMNEFVLSGTGRWPREETMMMSSDG